VEAQGDSGYFSWNDGAPRNSESQIWGSGRRLEKNKVVRKPGGKMKVLIAIESTEHSRATALNLSEHFSTEKTELKLLHVANALDFAGGPQLLSSYTDAGKVEQQEGAAVLAPFAAKLKANGFRVETEIVGGDTSEAILNAAEKWGADVIVVGSRGGGQMRQFLLGSVAYAVVRRAGCSVLVLRN
jgi:nucleotide-binding universal stress UspA family protein